MPVMTEEWVSFWYQCLTQNIDYGIYSSARRECNAKRCAELEARFERIADIYNDFGELDGWPDDGMQCPEWKPWFEPRRHLFMSHPSEVETPDQYVQRQGHLLIDLPLQQNEAATAETVRQFLSDYYAGKTIAPATPPKYQLHTRNGRLAHGYRQVQTACASVVRSYRVDPETDDDRRFEDAVAEFVRHEIDNMGWKLDPEARRVLQETGKLSAQRLESFKAMLTKCRRDFQAFAKNTIRGRFPDDSPFESTVLDMF